MKRQLVLRIEAEAGIAEAVNYYKVHSEPALQKFIEALDATFDVLLVSPQMYAVRWKTIRRVNLSGFPYALWYEIVVGADLVTGEDIEFVVVLRCFHQSRNVTARSFE